MGANNSGVGKPMRPDVALAFDRLAAGARGEAGLFTSVSSGFRSDTPSAAHHIVRSIAFSETPAPMEPNFARFRARASVGTFGLRPTGAR